MPRIYISLGSNCGNSAEMLRAATSLIARLRGVDIIVQSPLYQTEPQGDANQPWFLNQVVALDVASHWQPGGLLGEFLRIESELGRQRDPARRFGPRTIDIDLLLFGDFESDQPDCSLPHPRMRDRAFVLCPLQDIAPEIAIHGRTAKDWLAELNYRREGNRIWQE